MRMTGVGPLFILGPCQLDVAPIFFLPVYFSSTWLACRFVFFLKEIVEAL